MVLSIQIGFAIRGVRKAQVAFDKSPTFENLDKVRAARNKLFYLKYPDAIRGAW